MTGPAPNMPLRMIEVRGFKWPHRPANVAWAQPLGEDRFGQWLGAAQGDPWWSADGSHTGVFLSSLVKLVPQGTFWTACFNVVEPVVDVDIVLPVRWAGDTLEEVDLELDVLRFANGSVRIRDRDEFHRVRAAWPMPAEIVAKVEETCEQVRGMVETGKEPFGHVGRSWLERFLAGVETSS